MPYTPTTWCSLSSLINLASGLAPAAEISASNDRQDASGLAPDAMNFMKNQTYDYSFVSSAGLAPAVLTIANMMGSDLPTGFGPVGFWYNIQDASGLAPDAINFVKNQTYDFSFVSSAGLAPAVLTMKNMMGSDLPTRFRPVGFWYNIHKLILTGGISLF